MWRWEEAGVGVEVRGCWRKGAWGTVGEKHQVYEAQDERMSAEAPVIGETGEGGTTGSEETLIKALGPE